MSETNSLAPETIEVEGLLELNDNKSGCLLEPSRGGKTTPYDPFVPRELIRRFKLKKGSIIKADAIPDNSRANPRVKFIHTVDGALWGSEKNYFDLINSPQFNP